MTIPPKCECGNAWGVTWTSEDPRRLLCNGCYSAYLANPAAPDRVAAFEALNAKVGGGGSARAGQAVTTGELVGVGDVDREPVRWLGPGRIPLGKVVVLDGDPAPASPPSP